MTIRTANSSNLNDTKKGVNNATLKMIGADRLFLIDDQNVEDDTLKKVNLIELNLQGSPNKIESNGGLILNREALNIQYSKLMNGWAQNGGAIYNAGILSDKNKIAGRVSINQSLLQHNKADQGAVIYSEMPYYLINQSVIRDNEGAAGESGSILYVQTGFQDATIGSSILYSGAAGLRNSTVFHNKGGYIANIREGMLLNNTTILKNTAGLYLNAPKWTVTGKDKDGDTSEDYPSAYISNSILVANGNSQNCGQAVNDATIIQSNLTETECNHIVEDNTEVFPNFIWNNNDPEQTLIAGGENDEGLCAAPPAHGLLCPYYTPKDQMLGFFKPRLLVTYKQFSDSLIVNKGQIYSDGSSSNVIACETTDQRGNARSGYGELCDLGAIELDLDRTDVPIAGEDILYGDVAKFSIMDSLADGELLDPKTCEQELGQRSDKQAWQYGCLEVIQDNDTPKSKGTTTIDANGNITYTPSSNWHGADIFKLRVMTTATRLNDDLANRYLEVPTKIVQDPPDNFKSKTVSTGSFGISAILMLLGLIGLRRFNVL